MKGEVRIRLQVQQPAPLPRIGRPADVDPTVDVVKHDLESAWLPAPASGGGDVDRVPAFQGRLDRVFGHSHATRSYLSGAACIPSRSSASDRRCRPDGSKLSG